MRRSTHARHHSPRALKKSTHKLYLVPIKRQIKNHPYSSLGIITLGAAGLLSGMYAILKSRKSHTFW